MLSRWITVEPQKARVLLKGLPPEPPDANCTVIKLTTDGKPTTAHSYEGWPIDFGAGANR